MSAPLTDWDDSTESCALRAGRTRKNSARREAAASAVLAVCWKSRGAFLGRWDAALGG